MGKRGPKPKGKVKIRWSSNFAYAIGLLVSDGCLSSNGRHITLVSKDKEMLINFMKALNITAKIGETHSGYKRKRAFRVQFGDVLFYQFLQSIGLMKNKSKVIGKINVPSKYFFDFLRGSFDGDGCTHSYMDPRWRSSFMFYTIFVSASKRHIDWLQLNIKKHIGIKGHVTGSYKKGAVFQLKYAKKESLKVWRKMYHKKDLLSLSRKRLKINAVLRIIGERPIQ